MAKEKVRRVVEDDDSDLDFTEAMDGDESEEIEEDEPVVSKKKVAGKTATKRNREDEEVEPEDEEEEEKPSKKAAASSKAPKGGAKVKTATKKTSKPKTPSIPKANWETPYRPGSFSETVFKKAENGIKETKIHAFGKDSGANAGAVYRLVKQLKSGEQNGRRWTVDNENGFLQVTLKRAAKKAA